MRMTMRGLVMMAVLMAGAGAAGAQIIDPSTGVMVNAATDPMDYSDVLSGVPGNAAQELGIDAMATLMNTPTTTQTSADASSAFPDTSSTQADDTPAAPAIPKTAKPAILPKSGTFHGSVQVSLTDKDRQAVMFYTLNGKKPTTSSARYDGPITVTAKEKVEAIAFDVSLAPSAVASRTFKPKG